MTEEAGSSTSGDHSEDLTGAPPPLSIKLPQLSDLPRKGKPWRDVHLPVDILLLTVEECEFLACYAYMRNSFKSYRRELGYVYFGNMGDGDEPLKIALVQCLEGSSDPGCSQTVITNAVMHLQPKAVFSVGCCIGLNNANTQLGDVVISMKLTTETFKIPVGSDIAMIVKHADHGWKPPLESTDARKVNVYCNGDILSGMDQDTAKQHSELNSQAIAVEREGKGIFVAAHDLNFMEWVIVKGISDFADDSRTPSASWKPFACVMAASVVFNMLSNPVVFEDWPHYQGTTSDQEQSASGQKRKLPCSDPQDTKRRRLSGDFCLEECQGQLRSFYDSRSKVKIIPWDPSSAVPIDEIYTELSWLADDRKPSGVTQEKLEDYTDIFRNRKHSAEPKRILVYGRPGIGKTVFTQKTAFDWSQQRNQMLSKFDLVLLVKLRDVCDFQDVPSILKASEVLASDGKISVDDLYAYIRQHQEKVLLILDGYDEYSAGKQSPIRDIWERKLLRDCCVIVTTRQMKTDELRSPSDGQFEINGFDSEDQIKRFAKKFLNDENNVEEFWKYLEKQNLKDIAKISLLLLMLCLVWKENNSTELPSSRASIYTQFIQTFLNHMSSKDSDAEVSREIGDHAEELSRLGKLALDALLRGSLHLPLREVPGDLLTEKLIEVGLFQVSNLFSVNPDKGVFFIHKSVQEFLAAWYLRDELLSRKSENPTPLLKFDSIRKLFKMREVLQFASELSGEAAWEIVSHLGSVAKKESVTEYHFLNTPSVFDFTAAQLGFHELILDAFFRCSPEVRRERVSVFLSYVGCCLLINPGQLQSFAEEHLLKSTTLPNYIFVSSYRHWMGSLNRSVYSEQCFRHLITVLEDVDAVVVGCSGGKRASDFLKKYEVRSAADYLLFKREEHVYLHITGIFCSEELDPPFPIEMLRELVASPQPTQQEEPDANQSGQQDNSNALCLTENIAHNSSPARHCLSLVKRIFVCFDDWSEVETLTEIFPFVTCPDKIFLKGDTPEIIGGKLTKSLVSSIPFTDNLYFLGLMAVNLTAESVTIIATSLHQAPNLRDLLLGDNPLGEGVSVLTQHLSCVPNLNELFLEEVKMTKKQVNDLTTAVRQSNITRLISDYHDEEGNPLPEDEWPSEDQSEGQLEDELGVESEDKSEDKPGDESENKSLCESQEESGGESGQDESEDDRRADEQEAMLKPEDNEGKPTA